MNSLNSPQPDPTPNEQVGSSAEGVRGTEGSGDSQGQGETQPLRIRYRIRFSKSGLLRWISHRDLARLWERMLRRANFRLSMTQGFHPKPRIGFPSALALGVDGDEEVVELEFAEDLHPSEVLRRLDADQQPGLGITSVSKVPSGFKKPQLESSQYRITVPASFPTAQIQPAIEALLAKDTVSVVRKKKNLDFKTNTQILSLKFQDDHLQLMLAASEAATLRPHDVLDLLGFSDWVEQGSLITRTHVHLQQDIKSDDPSVIAIAGEP